MDWTSRQRQGRELLDFRIACPYAKQKEKGDEGREGLTVISSETLQKKSESLL